MTTKFFRKYQKALLIGFGIFLMIAFLLQQTLQELAHGRGPRGISVGGRTISNETLQRSAMQWEIVSKMTGGIAPQVLQIGNRGDHFVIAREEASRAGFVGGPTDGAAYGPLLLNKAADAERERYISLINSNPQFREIGIEQLQRIDSMVKDRVAQLGPEREMEARRHGMLEREVDQGFANARGIERMREAYADAPAASEQRLLKEARRTVERATLDLVFIGTDGIYTDAEPNPDEVTVLDHLNRYKAVEPGAGEMGFGYLRPAQVQLEWVKIDRAAVQAAIKVDPLLVQQRLRALPKDSVIDPVKQAMSITDTLRKEATDAAMADAATAAKAAILGPLSKLPDDKGYRVVPADWESKRPTAAQVAERINSAVTLPSGSPDPAAPRLPFPAPVVVSKPEWVAVKDLEKSVEGLGKASLKRGASTPVSFKDIASGTREIRVIDPKKKDEAAVLLQTGVPFSEPLEDAAGNRYFFCVTAARQAAPPASLDEIRDDVALDVRKLMAFQGLKSRLGLYAITAERGLDVLTDEIRTAGGKPEMRRNVNIGARSVPNKDQFISQELIDAVVDRMSTLDPTVALDKLPGSVLVVAAPVPARRGIVVARITGYTPLTAEVFRANLAFFEQSFTRQITSKSKDFTYSKMAERMGVEVPARKDGRKEEPDAVEGEPLDPAGAN